MAIGILIGAAVASKLVKTAVNEYQNIRTGQQGTNLNIGSVAQSTISEINKWASGFQEHQQQYPQTPVAAPVREEYEYADTGERYCEYCNGLIILSQGYTNCPHCGAAIRKANARVVLKKKVQIQVQQQYYSQPAQQQYYAQPVQQPVNYMPSGAYYVGCQNCRTTVRYTAADIHRKPSANQAVRSSGFKGHTGEVRCPRCGSWLPHYESNWRY